VASRIPIRTSPHLPTTPTGSMVDRLQRRPETTFRTETKNTKIKLLTMTRMVPTTPKRRPKAPARQQLQPTDRAVTGPLRSQKTEIETCQLPRLPSRRHKMETITPTGPLVTTLLVSKSSIFDKLITDIGNLMPEPFWPFSYSILNLRTL